MTKYLVILFFMCSLQLFGQTPVTGLFGFKLGQSRAEVKKKLGEPFQKGKFDDGFEYEVFLANKDTSLYLVFEYNLKDLGKVWSIQVSGKDYSREIGFKSVKLGIDKRKVEELFGKPDFVKDIGKYGSQWNYNSSKLSLEINRDGVLSSVKILDK